MSEDKHMRGLSRKWIWTGLIALLIAGVLVPNYLDDEAVNLTCLNSTDAVDMDQGFVMGNTSCRLRGSTFMSDATGARGKYYFECAEGNYEITAETSRVMPLVCSISGVRVGILPDLSRDAGQ